MASVKIVCYCGTSVTDSNGLLLFDRFLQSWALQSVPCNLYMSVYASNVGAVLDVIAKYEASGSPSAPRLFSNITTNPTLNHWNYLSAKWPTSTAYSATNWILFDDGFSIWESTRIQTLYNHLQYVVAETCIWCPTYIVQTYLTEDIIDPLVNNQSVIVYTNGTDNGHFMLLGPYSNYPVTGELNVYLNTLTGTAYKITGLNNTVWMFNRVSPSTYGVT